MTSTEIKVYVVSDCGINWPAAGLIFGIYDNEAAAEQRLNTLREGPEEAWSGTQLEDIGVRKFVLNRDTQG